MSNTADARTQAFSPRRSRVSAVMEFSQQEHCGSKRDRHVRDVKDTCSRDSDPQVDKVGDTASRGWMNR